MTNIENKVAFLKLWKWAKQYFRMRWFKHKNIEAFLREGKVSSFEEQLWIMRKSFETIKDNEIIDYTLKIEFLISKRPHFPMSDEEFEELSKRNESKN